MDLFEYHAQKAAEAEKPLADRLRPRSLEEFVGQNHVAGPEGLIRKAIESVVVEGKVRTYDMARMPGRQEVLSQGAANTTEMTDAIISKL